MPPPGQSANPELAYLRVLAGAASRQLGGSLVGLCAGGSWALGDYVRGRSDLDVALVLDRPLSASEAEALAAALSHRSIPCPARILELVAYTRDQAASPDPDAGFQLNLNTGESTRDFVETIPGLTARHWYPIDRDILARAGRTIAGPLAGELFAGPEPELLPGLLADSVFWHRFHGPRRDDAVLNACRAMVRTQTGFWYSKEEAGGMAVEMRLAPGPLVEESIEARAGGPQPKMVAVDPFLAEAEERLRALSPGAA